MFLTFKRFPCWFPFLFYRSSMYVVRWTRKTKLRRNSIFSAVIQIAHLQSTVSITFPATRSSTAKTCWKSWLIRFLPSIWYWSILFEEYINKKKYTFKSVLSLGEWWVSNPRPSEPQSDALTNWATITVLWVQI